MMTHWSMAQVFKLVSKDQEWSANDAVLEIFINTAGF